jgi:glycosyltransferase involved in cell wall biosynthesis
MHRSFAARAEWLTAGVTRLLTRDFSSHEHPLTDELHSFRVSTLLLGRYMLGWRPDCVLSFLPNTNLIALLARAWYGLDVPLLCADHNHLTTELAGLLWPRFRRFLIERHYPRATYHIAVAHETADDLVANFRVPAEKVVTIPNGVDLQRIRTLAQQSTDELRVGVPAGALRLVTVGRLTRQKGLDVLLNALALLRGQSWHLVILGDGEEEEALRALARRLGIAERVQFAGWRPNPYAWMAGSDVFVLSSRWEALPLVLLEALALGLPVVATDAPGATATVLGGGQYGRLVPPDSEGDLASVLSEVMADASLRSRLASCAADRAEAFALPHMIRGYERVFEKSLSRMP